MNEQPLVSIGIPTYNRPAGLKRMLDCITTQSYQNLEIIISDNASSDPDVEKIAYEFASRDIRIRYCKQNENKGAEFNFKFVLQQAHGKYFIWAADDDLWEPDMISSLANCAIENPDLVFIGGNFGTVNYVTSEKTLSSAPELKVENFPYANCLNLIALPCPSLFYFLFRRDILLETEFIHYHEFDFGDLFMLYEIALKGKMLTLPKLLYWAGIMSEVRVAKSVGRKIKWLRFDYFQYYLKSFKLFLKTDRLSITEKTHVIHALNCQLTTLISHHEAETLGPVRVSAITFPIKLIDGVLPFVSGIINLF